MRRWLLGFCILLFLGLLLSSFTKSDERPAPLRSFPLVTTGGTVATDTESAVLPAPASSSTSASDLYPVVRVIDGDTVIVNIGGTDTTLRLIGMDTPETVDPRKPVECFGKAASDEAHRLLDGARVAIEYDPSQGTLDTYGRTLAYIYMQDGTLYDEYMIAQGFAHEYTFRTPYRYQAQFKEAETTAREERKGLWADTSCAAESARY